jgi:hypothetical protein
VLTDVELALLPVVVDLQGHCAGAVGQRQTVVDTVLEVEGVDGVCDETNKASPITKIIPTRAEMTMPVLVFL